MKIIVLVKQVPNATEVKIDNKTGNLIREGVESIVNPDDLCAVETAVNLKKMYGGGHIVALTMGPPQAVDVLSEVMGMGVDEGIILSDVAFSGSDTWATSKTLGKAIKQIGRYDLVLCGHQAIDGDTAQVGPQVAASLDIPQITRVFEVDSVELDKMIVKRKTEEGHDVVKCKFPILLSIISGINKPKYPVFSKLISACHKKSSIKKWNVADIKFKVSEVGMNGSFTQVIKTISPKIERKGEFLEGNLENVVKILLNKIKENNLV